MVRLTEMFRGFSLILLSCCTAASASDIYRAENPDGSFRYATQRLDSTYQLYLKNSEEPKNTPPSDAAKTKSARQVSLEPLIQHYAKKHGVDTDLVRAVIEVESNFNAAALSPKGASGAMQLMPATARQYALRDPYDPAGNIDAGARHLRTLLDRFDLPVALAAYNAGEAAVARYGGVPPFRETRAYVARILRLVEHPSVQSSR